MSITVGQKAPDFSLVNDAKETFTLSDAGGATLLLFFPGAFTSVCTTELNQVNNDLARYNNQAVRVLGISTDSPFVLAEYKAQNKLQFDLLSDHNTEVSAAYGTKYEPGIFPFGLHRITRRAAFLMDAEGVVQYAEVLENAGNLPDFDAINAAVAAL